MLDNPKFGSKSIHLAGNVKEWTLESTGGSSVASRGGTGGDSGVTPVGSRSNSSISEYSGNTGIRAAMYEDTSNQASDGTTRGYYATLNLVSPIGTAGYVAQHVNEYYGKTVNYTPKNGANVKWKIFYAGKTPGTETSNIYLIADNYIQNKYAPKGINNTAITINGIYIVSFNNVINDYKGASDITNSRIKPWLSYLNKYPDSTNSNMKAVAYMLDTDIWSTFTDDDRKAEYAIGGPTFDLLCESYNQKYPSNKITYSNVNLNGYNSGYPKLTNDSLYVISSSSNANGMWLASPDSGSNDDVMHVSSNVSSDTYDCRDYYHYTPGLRPIVCLRPDAQLEKQSDGTYNIN